MNNNYDLDFFLGNTDTVDIERLAKEFPNDEFVKLLKKHGLETLLSIPEAGLTILWPSRSLAKEIAKHADKAKFENIVRHLLVEKLIEDGSQFSGAKTKSGKQLKIKSGSGRRAVFDNGSMATKDKDLDMKTGNGRHAKVSIWNISGGINDKMGGAITGDKNYESFNSTIVSQLYKIFFSDGAQIEARCAQKVVAICESLMKVEGNKEIINCLIQGNPLAEFFVLANSDIFDVDMSAIIASGKPSMSYNELYKSTKSGMSVASGMKCPEIADPYEFYKSVSMTGSYAGTLFICESLKTYYYPLREFYAMMRCKLDWAKHIEDSNQKEKEKLLRAIVNANVLSNIRSRYNNGLPELFYSGGESSGQRALVEQAHKFFGDDFLCKDHKEVAISGGSDGKMHSVMRNLSSMSREDLEKLARNPKMHKVVEVFKNNL